jgi:hypothetical protein
MATNVEYTVKARGGYEEGRQDGAEQAREAREAGHYQPGARDFDECLVNAIGNRKTRELFGLEGDVCSSDDPAYRQALEDYDRGAREAWGEADAE